MKYGRTLDYYSLGVLLYELITGLPPYYNNDQLQMQQDILKKPLRTQQFSGPCLHLIQGLLEKNPADRLGARHGITEIKDHPFFADISWADVSNHSNKYDKQFLKIDSLGTNFNTEHIEGSAMVDAGIDVDLECGSQCTSSQGDCTPEARRRHGRQDDSSNLSFDQVEVRARSTEVRRSERQLDVCECEVGAFDDALAYKTACNPNVEGQNEDDTFKMK